MPLTSKNVIRILREVTLGQTPKAADTPEEAKFRETTAVDVAKAKVDGLIIDWPEEDE